MDEYTVTRPKRSHRPPKKLMESVSEEQLDTELWPHAQQLESEHWHSVLEAVCGGYFPTRSSASGVERLQTPDRSEGKVCYQDLRLYRQDSLDRQKPAVQKRGAAVALLADASLRRPSAPSYRDPSSSSRGEQQELALAQSGASTARSSIGCAPCTPSSPHPPRKRFRSYGAHNNIACQAGAASLLAGAAWVKAVEALAVAGKLSKVAAAGKAGRQARQLQQ